MARRKIHFKDQHGAICGTTGAYCNRYSTAPLHLRSADVEAVTCIKCAKKLREWGFALQSFSEIVKEAACMKPEIRILAPARILEQAKKLKENKQYNAALELLERNSLEFLIYDTFLEARVSVPPPRKYHFSKS